jgi:hypothetical protein
VIRDLVFKRKLAKPTVSQIVLDFFANLTVRRDIIKITEEAHSEKQLRVYRASSIILAIKRQRHLANETEVHQGVDPAEQVLRGDERLHPDFGK